MARDLGIHIPPERLGHISTRFSEEDLALRRQVFWSCYTWDKTMSICLGRPPIINSLIELPTTDGLIDGPEADDESWQPFGVSACMTSTILQSRSWSNARFVAYCRLSTIIDGILDKLYSRPNPSQQSHQSEFLVLTLQKLDDWFADLKSDLRIKEASMLLFCPPPHILLLNLMFQTTVILLCKPFRRFSENARHRCTEAARMTDMLFTLHVRRFGFRCIAWLQTYTMFVACTIHVLDIKDAQVQGNDMLAREASTRVDFGLEILGQATTTPTASRCAFTIKQLLRTHIGVDVDGQQATSNDSIPSTTVAGDVNNRTIGLSSQLRAPSALKEQTVMLTDTSGESWTLPNMTTNGTDNLAIQTPIPENHVMVPRQENESGYDGGVTIDQALTNAPLGVAQFDKPRRWLPENVFDDGSWMLEDINDSMWPTPTAFRTG